MYEATVSDSVETVTVMASPNVSGAEAVITVTGSSGDAAVDDDDDTVVTLNTTSEGSTQITVTVTPANDSATTKSYIITVTNNAISADADLESLTLNVGTLYRGSLMGFDGRDTEYEARGVPHSMESVMVTAMAKDTYAMVEGDGEVALNMKETLVTIKVTAEDQSTVRRYRITIIKDDPSTDATLSVLSLWDGTDEVPITMVPSMPMKYTAMADSSVMSVTVTATPADTAAMAMVTAMMGSTAVTVTNGNVVALAAGDTVITVTVTAEDGTTMTYMIIVARDTSATVTIPQILAAIQSFRDGGSNASTILDILALIRDYRAQ